MDNRDIPHTIRTWVTKSLGDPNRQVNFMLAKICKEKEIHKVSEALTDEEKVGVLSGKADCIAKKSSIWRYMKNSLEELQYKESALLYLYPGLRQDYLLRYEQLGQQVDELQEKRKQQRQQRQQRSPSFERDGYEWDSYSRLQEQGGTFPSFLGSPSVGSEQEASLVEGKGKGKEKVVSQGHVYGTPHGGNGFASSSKNAKGNYYYDPVKDAAADRSSYQRTP